MKYHLPPGISVCTTFSAVTLYFRSPEEADAFVEFIKFLDSAPSGTDMKLSREEPHRA